MKQNNKEYLRKSILILSKKKGFTFVEMLLVTAMLSVIGLAVYSTFNNGVKLWMRINQQQVSEDIIIFFERISYDLKNSFKYTGIDFVGTNTEISFPAAAKFPTKEGIKKGIGRLNYFFDRSKKTLNIRQANYSEVYKEKEGFQRELVRNVESLNFKYYFYSPVEKEFYWTGSWQAEEKSGEFGIVVEKEIPLAVRIEVGVKDGEFRRTFQRTVFIPAAYLPSFTLTK